MFRPRGGKAVGRGVATTTRWGRALVRIGEEGRVTGGFVWRWESGQIGVPGGQTEKLHGRQSTLRTSRDNFLFFTASHSCAFSYSSILFLFSLQTVCE